MAEMKSVSSERLQAATRGIQPVVKPLSIIDCTTVYFSPTGVLVAYKGGPDQQKAIFRPALRESLRRALSSHPQFTGQLQWAPYAPSEGHTHRFQRSEVRYGLPNDPGAEFSIVEASVTLHDELSSYRDRHINNREWNGEGTLYDELFTTTSLALQDAKTFEGLPVLSAQATYFTDGGVTIGIKVAHPLADAQALMTFMTDWSDHCTAITNGHNRPEVVRPYEPALLDQKAAGNIDSHEADESIVRTARALPLHRYDQWLSKDTAPFHSAVQDSPPKDLDPPLPPLSESEKIPWHEWDVTKPCAHRMIHFTKQEIIKMHEEATSTTREAEARLSKHDCVTAHMWRCVALARDLQNDDGEIFFDMSLGLRKRVDPPLPTTFMGSPIMMAAAKLTGREVGSTLSLGEIALRMKQTWASINPQTMPAVLHDAAYEASSTRLWLGFLGHRHVMTTSWIHTNPYDICFMGGQRPTFVRPYMPACDGLMILLEAGSMRQPGNWYDKGVDIELYLEAESMERLLQNSELHKFR